MPSRFAGWVPSESIEDVYKTFVAPAAGGYVVSNVLKTSSTVCDSSLKPIDQNDCPQSGIPIEVLTVLKQAKFLEPGVQQPFSFRDLVSKWSRHRRCRVTVSCRALWLRLETLLIGSCSRLPVHLSPSGAERKPFPSSTIGGMISGARKKDLRRREPKYKSPN